MAGAIALMVGPTACGPSEPAADVPEAIAESVAVTPPATPQADTTPLAEACIRGGTPRSNVGRIMGEPDSVVYGSWFYGESEVLFGYGVVVEIRDRGELVLCD